MAAREPSRERGLSRIQEPALRTSSTSHGKKELHASADKTFPQARGCIMQVLHRACPPKAPYPSTGCNLCVDELGENSPSPCTPRWGPAKCNGRDPNMGGSKEESGESLPVQGISPIWVSRRTRGCGLRWKRAKARIEFQVQPSDVFTASKHLHRERALRVRGQTPHRCP